MCAVYETRGNWSAQLPRKWPRVHPERAREIRGLWVHRKEKKIDFLTDKRYLHTYMYNCTYISYSIVATEQNPDLVPVSEKKLSQVFIQG